MKRLLVTVLLLLVCAGCTGQVAPADPVAPPTQMQIEHLSGDM